MKYSSPPRRERAQKIPETLPNIPGGCTKPAEQSGCSRVELNAIAPVSYRRRSGDVQSSRTNKMQTKSSSIEWATSSFKRASSSIPVSKQCRQSHSASFR